MSAQTRVSTATAALLKSVAKTICCVAGSNVIVAGTAIFNAPEPEQVISLLKSTVDAAQAKIAKQA